MSAVTGLTTDVESVQKLLDAIAVVIKDPMGLLILIVILGWFLVNRDFKNIFQLFEYRQNRKLCLLENYISDPANADSDALQVAKEQRDTYYFKIATNGIYAEKPMRMALIKLHSQLATKISWTTIRRAFVYIELNSEGKVILREQTLFEKIGEYYNKFVAALFAIVSASVLVFLIAANEVDFLIVLKMVLLALFFLVCALGVLTQNFPIIAARRIKNEQEQVVSNNSGDV